ncbi:hypothetical protein APE_0871.1 [Aeropyrum pernix spindle-shaped virus 1]|uniref:Uncharacterized protein n=1 Tax=Aeropyrum pernix (strain ATCC 700893 / DSM 11879 / JCM 9820 / NBRC 100138 / K1) TaxID=272557 RepID=Q9YDP5_AERPE|nr:hypothetical protein [Aeropyrum pernix]BAA79852.2 hypothetical protein APE_0871.1 [Aeropyrum pernix spindle-shaped virus 1] [Aeropyrum pernix K1]
MASHEYKRNIYAYGVIAEAYTEDKKVIKLNYQFITDVVKYAQSTSYPLNSNNNPFSPEKIPIITDIKELPANGEKYLGIVYGYLRHEGLSHFYDRKSRRHASLSKKLSDDEDLYEYAHMILIKPGIALVEVTSFVPKHGILSTLFRGAAQEYCQRIGPQKIHVLLKNCDKIRIAIRQLYRPDTEELLKLYSDSTIKQIDIKLKISNKARLTNQRTIDMLLEKLGIDITKIRGQLYEAIQHAGRGKDQELDFTIDELLELFNSIREELGEESLQRFKITFGSPRRVVDLVEDALVFREVSIPKARSGGRYLRSTDTTASLNILKELALKNSELIRESYRLFEERSTLK